jgi:hypothetical protein
MKKAYDSSRAIEKAYLKRIIVSVKVANVCDNSKSLSCNAFVDTEFSLMVLPAVWKDRLGNLESTRTIEFETANRVLYRGIP